MKHHRLILGIILVLLLLSLMVYYELDHDKYDPDTWYVITHYEEFTTTKVGLSGVVKNVDHINNTLLVEVYPSPDCLIRVNTTESLTTAHPGDTVEMYGNFTGKNQMNIETLLIFPQWNNTLIYLRSLPAIPFLLYLFFKTYRFTPDTWRFERRKPDG